MVKCEDGVDSVKGYMVTGGREVRVCVKYMYDEVSMRAVRRMAV